MKAPEFNIEDVDGESVRELLKNALSQAGVTVAMYDYATMERGSI